jgi:hypothetical protein
MCFAYIKKRYKDKMLTIPIREFVRLVKATVPSGLSNYDDTLPYENEDKQLWDPTRLSEEVTREYLAKSAETTGAPGIMGVNGIPTGSHIRDDEQVGN